jgi:hypothetical protein
MNTDQGSDGITRGGETWPKELRITRSGDWMISEFNYEWLPGLFMWTEIGRIEVPMTTDVTIGMVVCATNNSALNTAILNDVVLVAPPYEKPWDLSPADGTTKVSLTPTLSWMPGDSATSHDVLMGTDPAALALVATKPLGDESYIPGPLEICTVYYWRIDEVEADGTTVHTGDVWSFTTVCKIAVDIDIKPRSCPNPLNVKSQGVLPVAILGSEDFDINTIDAVSVRLAGVAPIRSSYEDVAAPLSDKDDECECTTEGPDGYTDLNLKFETQEIVESIGELTNGEVLVLNLTGLLFDGTAIEGQDCIISVGNASRRPKGDLNVDGVVNMKDFAIIAEDWLQKADWAQ